ncbi:MAG: fructosamine kinase family protein [Halofilum sp. (in: g-proteobacteria)]|nr:fructosamine kinase family protein [Halofilum sp. (in: g-proteobacteria)]
MDRQAHDFWQALAGELEAAGMNGRLGRPRPLGGGCIHAAARVETGERALFVKRNGEALAPVFAAEAEGLEALAAAGGVRVPRPLLHGIAGGQAYLVTELVELHGSGDAGAFGAGLARMHASTAGAHGWHRDNWIGATVQANGWYDDWAAFWRERRLGPQLELAAHDGRGRLAERGQLLAERVDTLLAGHAPAPSVLHGDLWAGNHGYDAHGRGCIFDPAAYYGDRETDLAMTELFGGYPPAFRAGYEAEWPLPEGHRVRARLYNLYHVLNHAHLFGGGYAASAERTIEGLLAECGA